MSSKVHSENDKKEIKKSKEEKVKKDEIEWECAAVWDRSTLFDR